MQSFLGEEKNNIVTSPGNFQNLYEQHEIKMDYFYLFNVLHELLSMIHFSSCYSKGEKMPSRMSNSAFFFLWNILFHSEIHNIKEVKWFCDNFSY